MRRTILILTVMLAVGLLGCSGNQAEKLFETAKLEELQSNYEHSRKLYGEIIDKYPDSEYASKAKDRLSALQGQ